MNMLHREIIQQIIDKSLNKDLFRGQFGLEKENVRVDHEGKLALTPHPKSFGTKTENPYIQNCIAYQPMSWVMGFTRLSSSSM